MKKSDIRVVVAMSGGVDSSVVAALLKKEGYDVVGMMLRLWSEKNSDANRCCTPDSIEDARLIADQLGIPFYVLDYKEPFKQEVVEYFKATYQQGQTPNPCIICNKKIRFGRLLEEAKQLGARYMATGHYVRLIEDQGTFYLHKGVDPTKDQSYVLYRLDQEQLASLLFPLGDLEKTEVRRLAAEFQLNVAKRPDSQDLCFLGDEDYRGFLKRHLPETFVPGEIRNQQGDILGMHEGLPGYTIGQRRGLGISHSEPLYVTKLELETNRLIVGTKSECNRESLVAEEVCYQSGNPPQEPLLVTAKIRYTAPAVAALLIPHAGNRASLKFERGLGDITPGQSVVFYQGDRLVGGGVIVE